MEGFLRATLLEESGTGREDMIKPLYDDEPGPPAPASASSAQRLLVGLALLALLIGAVAFPFRAELITSYVESKFTPAQLHELARTELPELEGEEDADEESPPELYLRGKILVIQMGLTSAEMGGKYGNELAVPPSIASDFGELAGSLRASGPGDVDTVVAVRKGFGKYKKEMVGRTPVYDSKGRLVGEWISIATKYDPEHIYQCRILDLRSGVLVGDFVLTSHSVTDTPNLAAFLQALRRKGKSE
jgi:hypothetical protein